jgi:hypothetical protein
MVTSLSYPQRRVLRELSIRRCGQAVTWALARSLNTTHGGLKGTIAALERRKLVTATETTVTITLRGREAELDTWLPEVS